MWLWTSQCWHSTLVPMSDRVCRQRSVPYQPGSGRAGIGRCPEQPSLVPYAASKSAAVNGAEILGRAIAFSSTAEITASK